MIETRRTCVISMARLTESTVAMLRETPLADWPVMGAPMGADMFIIWAPTDEPAHDLPSDLMDALAWARRCVPAGESPNDSTGFDYVIFDRDVDPVEDGCDLPIYGYEVPGAPPSPETILRKLINRAQAYYHRKITKPEACPDGDNFNDLFGMIEEAEAALGAL
jgi:Ni,Fe-hydrogenase III small subunit